MVSDEDSAASDPTVLDLTAHFAEVTDPRIDRCKQHTLLDIIGLTICAVIAGADTFTAIERFGRARRAWLEQFLELEGGIPSHDTLGRVWSRINPTEFEAGFRRWMADLTEGIEEVIAIDGKTLRSSYDRESSKAALQMVNAWSCEQEVVLGQEAVPATTNETKTLPPLLHLLELEGAIVTIDAAGCYAEVAEEILRAGADYVITLKANQKHLYREAKALFDQLEAIGRLPEPHKSVDGGHDRVEVRRCWALAVNNTDVNNTELNRESNTGESNTGESNTGESNTEGWPGLSTICRIQSERHHPDGSIETKERLFISSLEADPDQLLKAVRHHWHVENKLHWSLDVAFGEDESRVRTGHAAQNLGVVRRLALSLLKQETSRSQGIAIKRKEAAWNPDYLLKVLTGGN